MDSEEKALSLYSDFREKLVRKRTSCNTVLQFVHIFCKTYKNKTSILVQNNTILRDAFLQKIF